MGQCGGCTTSNKRKNPLDTFWKEPLDTQKYSNMKLSKLQFQGSLANFKIKKCPYPALSIKIELVGVDTFHLRQKKIKEDQSAKWSFEQKFGFQMTEYELRKSFLRVQFQDEKENNVGFIQVNLYLISTGPYHQDFAVKLKKGQNTRISFDMKISQIIQIQVQSTLAEIDLITKHPGQKFYFSIKTIVGHNVHLNNSSPSYTVRVMLDNKEKKERQNSEKSIGSQKQLRKKKKQPQKQIEEGKNLVWKKEDYLTMPSITMKILVSQIHHSYFQLLIWKIDDKCTTKEETELPQLYGECYVALHKLFEKDPHEIMDEEGKKLEQHVIQATEKMWHHGKELGKGIFKFNIRNETYIKQMQVCVRTQEGILKYSPVFGNEKDKSSSVCSEVQELISIGEQIESNIISLDKLQTLPSVPNIESRKLKVSIEKSMERIVALLKTSSKESIIFFSYSSEKELMKAQKIFIDLGHKTLNYLEEEDVMINDLCWQILISLIKRGEFLLAHIGFDQNQKEKIKNKEIDKKLNFKIEVAIMYKEFVYKLLDLAFKALNVKGLEYERSFAEMFCAYAYFRISNFRTKLLEAIVRDSDPQILQWRGIQFSLKDDINYDELKQEVNTFTVLCDWGNSFHKCIEHEEKSQVLDNEMSQLLKGQEWRIRMSKRGIAFFYFVKYWVEYIESIAVKTKDIQWKYFPGYNKLIKCFLVQLKKRSILQYPDALKQASFRLLSNEKLLNSFVIIIYNKANIYEPLTVIKAIEFINDLFTSLSEMKRKIPATFNYIQFYKGLKIILESDFSFAISKTMILIYNHFNIFNMEFRKNISLYFLGKVFFNLFLHWSNNVRDTFHHFLIMRIYRESMHFGPQNDYQEFTQRHQQNNEQIRIRYQKLMLVLENAEKIKEEEDKMNFQHLYEKDLHKKLRKKLYEKKKKKKNSFDNQEFLQVEKDERRSCPNSPGSESMTSSSIFDEKYSIKRLSKRKQTSRFQSEILKPNIQLTVANKMNTHSQGQKFDEVKRITNKPYDFKHEIYDTTLGKKELMLSSNAKMNQFDQGDFQIGKMSPNQVEYLQMAMRDFKKVNQIFAEHANDKNWEAPKIKIEMPLDAKEIKPEKIDDW